MKRLLAVFSAAVLLFLAACGTDEAQQTLQTETAPAQNIGTYTFTHRNYPRMGGSLAYLPLGEAVTSTVLGVTRDEADELLSFAGSMTDNYKALINGELDILLIYAPGEKLTAYMEKKGVEAEMTPIGTDALAFICGKDNPVESLTLDQIKQIYSGKITNWNKVGGRKAGIKAYQRNKGSASQILFDRLTGLGSKLTEPPVDMTIGSMIGLLEAVAVYEDSDTALGYTEYYYLTNMQADKPATGKILAVDGVVPSNKTIAGGTYSLTSDFYVVIRKDAAEDAPERILYNWICSAQGRELLKREHYIAKQ